MKRKMKLGALGSALAMAGVLAFSGQVLADTVEVTMTYDDMSPKTGVTIHTDINNPGVDQSIPTTTGLFPFSGVSGPILTYGNDQIVTFCIDLGDNVVSGEQSWTVDFLSAAPDPTSGPMQTQKASDLSKLLGGAITSGVLNDARNLTDTQLFALQLAVWEVVGETGNDGYSATLGNTYFEGVDSTVLDQANTYLAGIGSATAMKGLVGLTSTTNQDFVAQFNGPNPFGTTFVPIPAAAWLFGSALLGTVALGRRKQRQGARAV